MEKTWNNKAWFLVLPVLVLVAFSAATPPPAPLAASATAPAHDHVNSPRYAVAGTTKAAGPATPGGDCGRGGTTRLG